MIFTGQAPCRENLYIFGCAMPRGLGNWATGVLGPPAIWGRHGQVAVAPTYNKWHKPQTIGSPFVVGPAGSGWYWTYHHVQQEIISMLHLWILDYQWSMTINHCRYSALLSILTMTCILINHHYPLWTSIYHQYSIINADLPWLTIISSHYYLPIPSGTCKAGRETRLETLGKPWPGH